MVGNLSWAPLDSSFVVMPEESQMGVPDGLIHLMGLQLEWFGLPFSRSSCLSSPRRLIWDC